MTTSRERVIRTLNHEPTDRVPRQLWASAATELLRGDELAEMVFRYPNDIVRPEFRYPWSTHSRGSPHEAGRHTDAWGCVWQVAKRGSPAQLESHPLADDAAIAAYRPPMEIVEGAKPDRVNRACGATSQFVLAHSETRPLDRLRMLRGCQPALADLAAGTAPIRDLLARLHEFSCREMEFWASTDVDGVVLCDDWGTETGLLLPREVWRELFRPLYRDYCRILHAHDKFVFFQSAGRIEEIFGELIQLGVDAIHSSLFLMDIQQLAARHRGKVVFWGQLDGDRVLRQGTPGDVREAVRRVRTALDHGRGGLIAQCEWDADMPFENIAAFFERWLEPMLAPAQGA